MSGLSPSDGVAAVALPGAVAAFAGAAGTAADLTADGLAAAAGAWLSSHLGRALPVLYARQQHTRITFVYGRERPLPAGPALVGVCDAMITAEPHVALMVRTADCLPVALAGGGAAAIAHAGWRGLAADILGATVARFASDLGVPAASLAAVIGVGVGRCHYAVGDEVIDALATRETVDSGWRGERAVDLAAYARTRLQALGLATDSIIVLPGCTACSPAFHSYRRDGTLAGRQWSAVVLTDSKA